jgi:hypothetical protein
MAACLAVSSSVTAFAQSAPSLGSWQKGPDGQGAGTIVGRIESPSAGQRVSAGANLLVSGWAADTTAAGWAGIDGVEVWSGAKDSGTKLATGMVGLSRPDVADALGAFGTSGFSAVVPASSLGNLSGSLYVYLHTPNKGTWFKTVSVNPTSGTALAFPTDPIIALIRPQDNEILSQKQITSYYSIRGIALDRNPITDPGNQSTGAGGCNCGISSVTVYLDAPPGQPGSINLGNGNLGALYGVNNVTKLPRVPTSSFSPVARQYGTAFDLAQWFLPMNWQTVPQGFHTIYAYARSSITGKVTGPARVSFFLKGGNKVLNP